MRKKSWIPLMLFVITAAIFLFLVNRGYDGAAHLVSTRGEQGVSLLYDTLRHMDYPVSVSTRPIDWQAFTEDAFIVIQPTSMDATIAEAMIEWVWRGGRLIFLQNTLVGRTAIDEMLREHGVMPARDFRGLGNIILYQVGQGEILTGRAFEITNAHLMYTPYEGRIIESTLRRWNADRIIFAEYYQGFNTSENFIGGLPLIVRLILFQMIIAAVMLIWNLGKRFGKPIPYYEETEREENEYVRALARLIWRGK